MDGELAMESDNPISSRRIGTKTAVIALAAIVMSATLLANCSANFSLSDSITDATTDAQTNTPVLYCGFEEHYVPPFFFLYGTVHDASDLRSHSGDYSYAVQSDLEVIALYPDEWLVGGDSSQQPNRVVVWMYDPGPEYYDKIGVRVRDTVPNGVGIGNGGYSDNYYHCRVNADFIYTDIEREPGWHKFEFVVNNMGTTCYIDNIKVCETSVLTVIDELAIGDWWGDGIVSSNVAFDDVVVTVGHVGGWEFTLE